MSRPHLLITLALWLALPVGAQQDLTVRGSVVDETGAAIPNAPVRALYWINEFGSFIQDQITVNPKLQLQLGFRYDWQNINVRLVE